ncbi:hypothetical protein K2173_021579 [Erythroxylum novogranatense]|uniref:ferroxidase n=1 Tax=Erythroxylum novogranatense TaxID=1862640 RepID=A0AAV8TNC3_9ROSI|nr:hypothetical protein K2173_021579 [Erythroxylum novogranatense]
MLRRTIEAHLKLRLSIRTTLPSHPSPRLLKPRLSPSKTLRVYFGCPSSSPIPILNSLLEASGPLLLHHTLSSSRTLSSQCPTAIDYRSVLQESEFHKLADSTIHALQEKLEEYGDSVQIEGYDVEYGNEVLTLKLGDSGTYVLNKQTPNRQLWLSSPISGPSRFDWDQNAGTWVYRRTKANLFKVLESELEKLCGEPIELA